MIIPSFVREGSFLVPEGSGTQRAELSIGGGLRASSLEMILASLSGSDTALLL